jgi:hypothetical protein
MRQATRWKDALDELNAPAEVIDWASAVDNDFPEAWRACNDPFVRIWIARAGGVSQAGINEAVAALIRRALQSSELTDAERDAIGSALDTLFEFLDGNTDHDTVEVAANRLASARLLFDGAAKDLAFATDCLLRASKDVTMFSMPHDFMWLIDADGALKVVVSGSLTGGFIAPREADGFLSTVWHPSAAALHPTELTDEQLVGQVLHRALGRPRERSGVAATVALTMELEQEIVAGGFGRYFAGRSLTAGIVASSAYEVLGRRDLAITVREATEAAREVPRGEREHHAAFRRLDARFAWLLEDDPTRARADFIRRHIGRPHCGVH